MKNSLPRLMLITERAVMTPSTLDALRSALAGGARLVQLRDKELPGDDVHQFARDAKELCDHYGAQLLINSYDAIAQDIGAGLHLPESETKNLAALRETSGDGVLLGASAHSIEAARHAQQLGADYIVFGSIFPTQSHPGSTPAGLEALRQFCEAIEIPVFAVGGITTQNAGECMNAGAHGVAVIRAVWSTPNPAAAVRELLEIVGS